MMPALRKLLWMQETVLLALGEDVRRGQLTERKTVDYRDALEMLDRKIRAAINAERRRVLQ